MSEPTAKPRLLTGDTPTGQLHLGHWVGSLENRLAMQETHDCFFLIANKHAFTTRADKPEEIRQSVLDVATDWLAIGIDPDKSAMFVQSEVPAIDELTFFFAMLLPFNRVMRNPTLAQEIKDKGLGDKHSFGFPLYAVGQCADILAFRPDVVPVGEDQTPHLEMTREVARKFDQLYCGVDSHADDADYAKLGGVLPVPQLKIGRVGRLPGINGPVEPGGPLQKMSKSLNNAIYLGDSADELQAKVRSMYTDPARLRKTDAGNPDPDANPLFAFLRSFHPDQAWVDEQADAYAKGGDTAPGDMQLKKELVQVLEAVIAPIREKRAHFEQRPDDVMDALKSGTARANAVAEETLALCKAAMKQDFFERTLTIK
ncbi:MAG: tryptophan--tRNA ligase [Planctomycetota bacterium]